MVCVGMVSGAVVIHSDTSLLLDFLFILVRQHLLQVLRAGHEENELVELNVAGSLRYLAKCWIIKRTYFDVQLLQNSHDILKRKRLASSQLIDTLVQFLSRQRARLLQVKVLEDLAKRAYLCWVELLHLISQIVVRLDSCPGGKTANDVISETRRELSSLTICACRSLSRASNCPRVMAHCDLHPPPGARRSAAAFPDTSFATFRTHTHVR